MRNLIFKLFLHLALNAALRNDARTFKRWLRAAISMCPRAFERDELISLHTSTWGPAPCIGAEQSLSRLLAYA